MDHATPSTRWSLVTVSTERERFGGRTSGGVCLERLEAHFKSYADEAARPVALDLDGTVAIDDWLEPCFELVLAQARRLLRSGELGQRLSLPSSSYREATPPAASAEALVELGAVLDGIRRGHADPRPLAAVLAAELGAVELGNRVSRLATSPHPLVAAVARAAAVRLGVAITRVGAVDELADFVEHNDLEQIRRWSQPA
jgi:hypothetical protein